MEVESNSCRLKTNHWVRLILIFLITLGAIWYFTGERRYRSDLSRTAEQSSKVTLERFGFAGETLESVSLSGSSLKCWLTSLKVEPGALSHTHSKCWVPHHRVRIETEGSDPRVVEICFACNEFSDPALGRRKIPDHWREPLRELFRAAGIPDMGPDRSQKQAGNADPLPDGARQISLHR